MLGRYTVLVWLLALASATEVQEKRCVNHPLSSCPPANSTDGCLCQRIEADQTVICCNIHSMPDLNKNLSCASPGQQTLVKLPPVMALHILNSSLEKLDVNILPIHFKELISLSVTHSHIPHIMGRFADSITCLNLSSNYLHEVDPMAFSKATKLGYLDLSLNNLTDLPQLDQRNTKSYLFLDLSGNNGILCKQLHELTIQARSNSSGPIVFVHDNETFCSSSSSYNWFKSVNIIPFIQLENLDKIDKECPHGPDFKCRCELSPVEMTSSRHYFVDVDCSGQGLTELPAKLPPSTTSLNISNNNITHLDFLGTNENYRDIMKIYADNNRIESITVLEGSQFIDKFTALSLRNNNIKVIPKYLLSNVFDRNSYQTVNLGMNRLHCDCYTAQVLKVWLLANRLHINDYDELLCENLDNMRVVDLDQKKVCVYPRDWTDYIYYIIAIEILLFVLLVSKVSYDYWVFKTTGYLPWPASKMPRLPCDWVFEL